MIQTDATRAKIFFENSYKKLALDENRKNLLLRIADSIAETYKANNGQVSVNFICTHNSRRSQLGQVWTFFASHYFNLNVTAYSGGTEVTAFHRNTVQTLKSVGFTFQVDEFSHQNPVYRVSFNGTRDYILGFSKTFDHHINQSPYIAITTCDSADQNCPYIAEAIHRFHLPYEDPKSSDGTPEQEATYLKTNGFVASEIYFIFMKVKEAI
jgi:arsenate reductase